MDTSILQKYAEFTVRSGVNLQPGQVLIIDAPVHGAQFANECARVAFELGAKDVAVHYASDELQRLRLEHAGEETACEVLPWQIAMYEDYLKDNRPQDIATLRISSPNPEGYAGLDTALVAKAERAKRAARRPFRDAINGESQWCIVAIPSGEWAKKVFPALGEEEAVEALWSAIFSVTRMDTQDPTAAWDEHTKQNMARRGKLNDLGITAVHMSAPSNGTDLHVRLADGALWEGVLEWTRETALPFIPNIPTDEIFTTPHRAGVNGIVYGSKPFVHNGGIVDGFCLEFTDGVVTKYSAKQGEDLLGHLINTDEHSCRLGEFALVPYSSPINQSGLLFYSTLFDENAACHIALGASYSDNRIPEDELLKMGYNSSLMHADVMVGAVDTNIVATTAEGKEIKIFENGEWAEEFLALVEA